MSKERPRDEYYRDAAHFLNLGEKAAVDSGELATALAFLTRGQFIVILCCC